MSKETMSKTTLGVLLAAGFVAAALTARSALSLAHEGHHHVSPAEQATKILKRRLAILEKVVKLRTTAYQNGQGGFNSVLTAQVDLLSAKLELAKTNAQRIAIREATVKAAKQLEDATRQLEKAGQVGRVHSLNAQAFRLRAEADLLMQRAHKHEHKHPH